MDRGPSGVTRSEHRFRNRKGKESGIRIEELQNGRSLRSATVPLTLTLAPTLPYGLGNAGTRAVSMILEYSMDTLPARSILVALPGSA
jgi:hypothetical protein